MGIFPVKNCRRFQLLINSKVESFFTALVRKRMTARNEITSKEKKKKYALFFTI